LSDKKREKKGTQIINYIQDAQKATHYTVVINISKIKKEEITENTCIHTVYWCYVDDVAEIFIIIIN